MRSPFASVLVADRFVLAFAALAVAIGAVLPSARAQAHRIASPADSLLEAGAPLYAVRTQEALGLNESPTDIQRLPDGRLLVFAGNELAFGDGSRWQIYRQAPDDPTTPGQGLAVDEEGNIFMGVAAGFAQVVFDAQAQWRLQVVAPWSAAEGSSLPVMRYALQANGQWFWHSGTGALFSWRPGETARFRGRAETIEQVLHLDNHYYLSDRTSGRVWRLADSGAMEPVMQESAVSVSETPTCGLLLEPGQLLIGTYARGLRVFDGHRTRPFVERGLLASGVRINDLCETEGGYLAAAVENVGIVFFDRQGRMLQILDRALDHRLSHVRRLLPAPGGVVWGQLNEGILRVEFPSRMSHFEPLIGSGLAVAHPDRLNDRLWVMADGKVHRGIYDHEGRLTRFEEDTPGDRFAFAFSCAPGWPVVGTNRGAYFRHEDEWREFFPNSANFRILDRRPIDGRWLYGAVGEVGWLRPVADTIVVEQRIPVSGLGNLYNAITAQDGTIWLELGNRQVGRVRLSDGQPQVDILDRHDGLPEGWVNIFSIDDRVGFNVEGQILRFEENTHHFTPDPTFAERFPGLENIVGRPARDARGRVWISANGAVQVFASRGDRWVNIAERMPPGFLPNFFTVEENGVVWLHAERRLARYDPAMPLPEYVPLRAIFTGVHLPASGRTLVSVPAELPALDYDDNSLIAHFGVAGNPVAAPVHFEVRLAGRGGSWNPVGAEGTAAVNGLREGRYVLHVRPQSGGVPGVEATLPITIHAPWYRTTWAYVLYAASALGVLLLATWVAVVVTRNEKRRLQEELAQRVQQVDELTARLARANTTSRETVPARAARTVG